jgi:rsbT co-antagonist protein RsbR
MTASSLPRTESQIHDLALSLRLTAAGALIVGLADVGAGLAIGAPAIVAAGALTLAYGLLVAGALWLTAAGRSRAAALTNACGMLALAVLSVVTTEVALPAGVIIAVAAPIFAISYVSQRDIRAVGVASVCAVLAIILAARFVQPLPPIPEPLASLALIFTTVVIAGLVVLIFLQVHGRLSASVGQLRDSNSALAAARANLEARVEERTAGLRAALAEIQARSDDQTRLLAENARQRSTIAELGVPVLPVGEGVLVMPLVGALDGERLAEAQRRALEQLGRERARGLILDVTGVPVIDSEVAAGLIQIGAAARLLGAEATLVGLRPEVAQTIVWLGLDLGGLAFEPTLAAGISRALRRR